MKPISNNVCVVPEYLNLEFVEKALKCEIKSLDIENAIANGDNFLSDVFRIKVHFVRNNQEEFMSIIVKCMPETEFRGPANKELNVFDKETDIFMNILPEISGLANEFFAAKCFHATKEPVQMVTFQDLKALGYKMANRHCGLDYKHCKIVLNKIAKFHAASMVFAQKSPDKVKIFNHSFFNRDIKTSCINKIFEGNLKYFITASEDWDDLEDEIKIKLKKLLPVYVEKLVECTNQDNFAGINVLNHGDLWVNNLMFCYESDEPEDVAFVDFQLSFYTSPGIDLNYFFTTSPNQHVRENCRDDLTEIYYKALVEQLDALKFENIPTFQEILDEIEKYEFFVMIPAITILPIVMKKKSEETLNFDALQSENKAERLHIEAFREEKYHRAILLILNRLNNLKLLDV